MIQTERSFCPYCKQAVCISNCEEEIKNYQQAQEPKIKIIREYELYPGTLVTIKDEFRKVIVTSRTFQKHNLKLFDLVQFGLPHKDSPVWLIRAYTWKFRGTLIIEIRRLYDYQKSFWLQMDDGID